MDHFVTPAVKTLRLSTGATVTVRTELTYGEQLDYFTRIRIEGSDPPAVDPVKVGPAQLLAYLVDWTIPDADGLVVPLRGLSADEVLSTIRQLKGSVAREILQAIDGHETAALEAQRVEKKTPRGETVSAAT